ncbi:hypothetical protein [Actinoallomurus soli]|uniref:hypothetical protein n=1 Tax=Actinoallomurus soli TaxID=2952535 RepID=UPI002093BA9B|nr:hypothetical protein [Actinoallomurus soli]MCO5972855.1 hypothetical protein [Actinoallomurus soli]
MSKATLPLPTFSANWVGGDIQGLSGLAQVLYNFAEDSKEPVADLNRTVTRLVRESGASVYPGSAVGEFKDQFGQDLNDINWLSQRATSIGEIVDNLALNLAKIECWLEKQAERGVAAGYVVIDRSGNMSLPRGSSNPKIQTFLGQFNQRRAEALAAAEKVRRAAAQKLASEYKMLAAGMVNYRNNHRTLLSQAEINSLASQLAGLEKSFTTADYPLMAAHPPDAHKKGVMKDLAEGVVLGDFTIAGGVIGTLVPAPGFGTGAGIGVGAAVGAVVAPLVGAIFD